MKDFKELPLITIGIPVYNVEDYIGDALHSVLDQTYPNLEILIVDDKTPDKSIEVAKQIVALHPRRDCVHFLYHEQNRGLSCARNTIIDAATGEYLFFLDSDDYISADCIEKLYSYMAKYDADYVEGSFDTVNQDTSGVKYIHEHSENFIKDAQCVLNWKKHDFIFFDSCFPYINAWNKLINYAFLKKMQLRFEPGRLYEDGYFSFMLSLKATSCYVSSDVTYHYRIRDNSIMHKGVENYTEREIVEYCKYIEWKKKIIQQYKNRPFYDILIKEVVYESLYAAAAYHRKRKYIAVKNMTPFFKKFLSSPFTLKDILKYSQHKSFNVLLWMFYTLPLPVKIRVLRYRIK